MLLSDFLAAEWKPALGCTEPAAVAWAAALAAGTATGEIRAVRLVCDPRIYKNCYAVGLPNSNHRTGILWALAIGANLEDASLGLKVFEATTEASLRRAQELLDRHGVSVDVDSQRSELYIDLTVVREGGTGRAVIERDHTNLVRLESDGRPIQERPAGDQASVSSAIRAQVAGMSIQEVMDLARSLSPADRKAIRLGVDFNLEIARLGASLLPEPFLRLHEADGRSRAVRQVGAGVAARMSGVSQTVMTLAGSGNKGITVSLPVWLWGQEAGHPEERIEEALAFAFLMTSVTTHHLGTLSAACGSAIAAGAGIAAGVVLLEGGSAHEAGLAVSSVVGTLAGMICDGAKVGCAMKTSTGVETAFRAADFALSGHGIPESNGIVGKDGATSLLYLGLVVTKGMANVDAEILDIMQRKLEQTGSGSQ
jgi:L-cysteine desulfidase